MINSIFDNYFKNGREYERMEDILNKEVMVLVKRAKELNKIPSDIAINTPFKENLLTMFICIFSRTPLFVCGKPGSSKTLTVNILNKMFKKNHNEKSEFRFFEGFQNILIQYYQGSEQTTDKGIENIFTQAYEKLILDPKCLPLVFIDEIGLAELSPHNPLKVLHKFLDSTEHGDVVSYQKRRKLIEKREKLERKETSLGVPEISYSEIPETKDEEREREIEEEEIRINEQEIERQRQLMNLKKLGLSQLKNVSFIGISNWNIDASKMNRNVYLARPDLDNDTLYVTGRTIIRKKTKNVGKRSKDLQRTVRRIIMGLSATYSDFRTLQKTKFLHKNFHTLRDFYYMMKKLGEFLLAHKEGEPFKLTKVSKVIDMNFSGIFTNEVIRKILNNVEKQKAERGGFADQVDKVAAPTSQALEPSKTNEIMRMMKKKLRSKKSSQKVFKIMFVKKTAKTFNLSFDQRQKIKNEFSIKRILLDNLTDRNARYFMAFYDLPLTIKIMQERIKK